MIHTTRPLPGLRLAQIATAAIAYADACDYVASHKDLSAESVALSFFGSKGSNLAAAIRETNEKIVRENRAVMWPSSTQSEQPFVFMLQAMPSSFFDWFFWFVQAGRFDPLENKNLIQFLVLPALWQSGFDPERFGVDEGQIELMAKVLFNRGLTFLELEAEAGKVLKEMECLGSAGLDVSDEPGLKRTPVGTPIEAEVEDDALAEARRREENEKVWATKSNGIYVRRVEIFLRELVKAVVAGELRRRRM